MEILERIQNIFFLGEHVGPIGSSFVFEIPGFATYVSITQLNDAFTMFNIKLRETPESRHAVEMGHVWDDKGSVWFRVTSDLVTERRDETIVSEGDIAIAKLNWILDHCSHPNPDRQ